MCAPADRRRATSTSSWIGGASGRTTCCSDEVGVRSFRHERERPYRKTADPLHLRGNGKEAKPRRGQLIQSAQVLDDGDAGRQQGCVRGPRPVLVVVDVERVDADERRAGLHETSYRGRGEERVALPVPLGAPVAIPARVHEHGLPPGFDAGERILVDRATPAAGVDYKSLEVRHVI